MPVVSKSNNRILPANSRAVDVAKRGVQEITPVFQTRHANAFKVQGCQGILYNRLEQGVKCSCNAARLNAAVRLDEEGKLSEGAITEMMTGVPSSLTSYSVREEPSITSPQGINKHQESGTGQQMPETNADTDVLVIPLFRSEVVKDDGAARELDLDELVGGFDTSMFGVSDIACPVCFGTGYVGGFSVLYGYRQVVPCNIMTIDGEIAFDLKPFRARSKSLSFNVTVPLGITSVDSFKLYDMRDIVTAAITINGMPASDVAIASLAGQQAVVSMQFRNWTYFTHFEFQCCVSDQSAYFELPKTEQSADLSLLDSTQPFQVLFSPDIPRVFKQDVVVESKYGKVLVVGAVTGWETTQMMNLGTDAQVRVAQPQELYNILPRRGRVLTKEATTVGVHDNRYGQRRT